MTKIAVLSDIHGNTTALEAVLTDAKKANVEYKNSIDGLIQIVLDRI